MSLKDCIKLCDYYTSSQNPKMKWMWGEGLLGYALDNLDDYLKEERYFDFLKKYTEIWSGIDPEIMSSDTCAPGLITYSIYKKTGDEQCKRLTEKVLHYMKNEPRSEEGLVNHMGHNGVSKWYPSSIWVDSLMMFGVFASLYGKENHDDSLIQMAVSQTLLFSKYLMDEEDRLWYHSYYLKGKYHYPKRKIYWGRGNAWVIAALPKILDQLEQNADKEKIKTILKQSADAMVKVQNKDGSFNTLLKGFGCYKETSATALVAEGLFHAVRKGYLDETYLPHALLAYRYCESQLVEKEGRVLLQGISNPTIPLPLLPWTGYAVIGRRSNWSYGIAAYIWASIEKDLYDKR